MRTCLYTNIWANMLIMRVQSHTPRNAQSISKRTRAYVHTYVHTATDAHASFASFSRNRPEYVACGACVRAIALTRSRARLQGYFQVAARGAVGRL